MKPASIASRGAFALAATLLASQAHASLVSFAIEGRIDYWQGQGGLVDAYPQTTPVSGVVTIDDAVAPRTSGPGYQDYSGNYSGVFHFGANTVTVSDSFSYVWESGPTTMLVLLGGNAWNTGGAIGESQAPAGFAVQGLQIMLGYAPSWSSTTPPTALLELGRPLTTNFYLYYGNGDGVWGTVTDVRPLQGDVPEPAGLALLHAGAAAMLGRRRAARRA